MSVNILQEDGLKKIAGNGITEVDSELSETSENPVQNKAVTEALSAKSDISAIEEIAENIQEKLIYIGSIRVPDSDLGRVAEENNVPEKKPYIFTNNPISDGQYIQGGYTHLIIGMEYGSHRYGAQVSIGGKGILHRELLDGNWGQWRTVSLI